MMFNIHFPSRTFRHTWSALIVASTLAFTSCLSIPPEVGPEPVAERMEDIAVPSGFSFSSARKHDFRAQVQDAADQPIQGVLLYLYAEDEAGEPRLLTSGRTDVQGEVDWNLKLPAHVQEVYLYTPFPGLVSGRIFQTNQLADRLQLGGSQETAFAEPDPERYGSSVQRLAVSDNFSSRYVYVGSYNSSGVPNYLEPQRDVITQDLLDLVDNSLPEGQQVPVDNPQYIAGETSADTRLEDSAEVFITFVHEGAGYRNALGYYTYDLNNPPTTVDDIDSLYIVFPNASYAGSGGGLLSGDKVKLGNFSANTGIGWFLVPNGWASWSQSVKNEVETKFSNPDFNTYTSEDHQAHTALLLDPQRELLLLGMEDITRPGGDKDFNDAVFYVTANPFEAIDTVGMAFTQPAQGDDLDQDGVIDLNDLAPEDPDIAFESHYPGEDQYGSLAFEDLWPNRGDYDLNDAVIDYQFKFFSNTANRVVRMDVEIVLRALGGSMPHGFGIELPIAADQISSVTGSEILADLVTLAPNGVEAGQSNAVIIAYDHGHKLLGANTGDIVNTDPTGTVLDPDTVRLSVQFATPVSKAELGYAPFNPFIFTNRDRGREVHLLGHLPTDLADPSLFGTGDDITDPNTSQTYQTATGLPWAIDIPQSFQYPEEKVPFLQAYERFAEWVESGGALYQDWYTDKSGYRNMTAIYQ